MLIYVWLWSLMAIGAAKFERNGHTICILSATLMDTSGRQACRQVRCNLLNMQAAASKMKAEGY